MPHGKLIAVVDGVTDIKSSGVNGGNFVQSSITTNGWLRDFLWAQASQGGTFCTLACGSQVFSSPTVEGGGSHPFFKTVFEFEIDRTTNELDVCVYKKGSTSTDNELVGFCTLNFNKVFYHGHTVPLTAYSIQQPSGNPGRNVNISFKFKMRPSPNEHNTHAPMRCSSPPRVTHYVVCRQSLAVDWGYDCHEDASEVKSYRRTQSDSPRHQDNYRNLPGTASYNEHETKPNFIRYRNLPKLCPESSQTPNHARPSPVTEYSKPIPQPQPQVFIQPQVQVQVEQRPSPLVHLAGEAVNGLAEGVRGELANQFVGGVAEAVLGSFFNF